MLYAHIVWNNKFSRTQNKMLSLCTVAQGFKKLQELKVVIIASKRRYFVVSIVGLVPKQCTRTALWDLVKIENGASMQMVVGLIPPVLITTFSLSWWLYIVRVRAQASFLPGKCITPRYMKVFVAECREILRASLRVCHSVTRSPVSRVHVRQSESAVYQHPMHRSSL